MIVDCVVEPHLVKHTSSFLLYNSIISYSLDFFGTILTKWLYELQSFVFIENSFMTLLL